MNISSGVRIVLPKALLFLMISFSLSVLALPQERFPYLDSKLPVEQRIADLLPRMTLEEKVAQLTSAMGRPAMGTDSAATFVDAKGLFQPEGASVLLKHGIGQIAHPSGMRGPHEMAEFTNAIQKWVKNNTRLGIPVLFHDECLHGHVALKGTSFPQAIALQ